jgi:chitinase
MASLKRIIIFCICFLVISLSNVAASSNENTERSVDSFRIAGYLPDYRFGIDLNSTTVLLDDLYLFSLSPQPQLGAMIFAVCCLDKEHYQKARQAADHAKSVTGKEVKIWVTVGGGGRSNGFTKNPGAMIGAIKQLLVDEKFHGVDFDCELFRTHQDYVDYDSIITNAAYVLHKEGKHVSVALHAGQIIAKAVYEAVDRVNLMTYDMMGSSYHADFGKAREAVDTLIKSGCPAHKIFLGLPAYGRHKLQQGETKTFSELMDVELQRGRSIDELRMTYEINDFIFDSPAAISSKVRYAIREGLGGVFFWELGQDKQHESAPSGMLLHAAAQQVAETNFSDVRNIASSSTERTTEIYEALKQNDEL